jgi:hypothetical protein
VTVQNKSANTLPEAVIACRVVGDATPEGAHLVQTRGWRKLTVGATPGMGTPLGNIMRYSLGALPPGGEATGLIYLVFSGSSAAEQANITAVESAGGDVLLDATRRTWDSYFADAARFDFPDQKLADWVDDMVVTDAVQTAENGQPSPMSRYTSAWMRDTEGPLRMALSTARHGIARRMLDTYYKGSIMAGGIQNSFACDQDVANAPPPPNWMTASFMPGRNPVEAPSYVVLNAWQYYRATGDATLLQDEYDFLKAAVLRQERSPDNLMKFEGDEPFRWVMAAALGLYEPENLGWSSNSAFLFVAAAERLGAIAGVLGQAQDQATFYQLASDVRAATDKNFFINMQPNGFYDVCKLFTNGIPVGHPFEDISLMPLRLGYAGPKDALMRQNLFYAMQQLGHPDGSILSPFLTTKILGVEAFDGMVPGYYVTNLAMIDHPSAEKAFNHLEKAALNTGEIVEGELSDDTAAILQYHADGTDPTDVVARYRPWEGSLCVQGALDYLLGVEPDAITRRVSITPHMPNGWGSMAAWNLKFMDGLYDVEVRELGERRLMRVTNHGTQPLEVDLGVSILGAYFSQLFVDGVPTNIPPVDAEFGRIAFRLDRTIQPGQWVDVDVTYVR